MVDEGVARAKLIAAANLSLDSLKIESANIQCIAEEIFRMNIQIVKTKAEVSEINIATLCEWLSGGRFCSSALAAMSAGC